MKKVLLSLALIAVLYSCSPEEKDCDCNKVVEVLTMNIVGAGSNISVTKYYNYTTINECTGIQRSSGWSTDFASIGQCK